MSESDVHQPHRGVVHSATEVFLNSTRTVVGLVSQAGSAGAQALVPDQMLVPVTGMLSSMRRLFEQAPQIGDELEVLISELHAKRLTIQAVTAELSVLDAQLEILERTIVPVQTWSRQWNQIAHSLVHALDEPAEQPQPE